MAVFDFQGTAGVIKEAAGVMQKERGLLVAKKKKNGAEADVAYQPASKVPL